MHQYTNLKQNKNKNIKAQILDNVLKDLRFKLSLVQTPY